MANVKGILCTSFNMYSARRLSGMADPKVRKFPRGTRVTIAADLGHVETKNGNLYSYHILVETKNRLYTAIINKDLVERCV